MVEGIPSQSSREAKVVVSGTEGNQRRASTNDERRFPARTVEILRVDSGRLEQLKKPFQIQQRMRQTSGAWFEPRTRNCSDVRKLSLLENSESH